jgi:hypothetical protein
MPEPTPGVGSRTPAPRRRLALLASLLFVLLVVLAWNLLGKGGAPETPAARREPQPTPPALRSEFITEQEWLVSTIVRHLAEVAQFAERSQPLQDGQLRVQTTVDGSEGPNRRPVHVEATLAFDPDVPPRTASTTVGDDGHLWSPREYVAVVEAFLTPSAQGAGPPAKTDAEDRRLLKALLDPRASTLTSEDSRLARQLSARPLDPIGHERAALLVGALALRERGSSYADPRTLLCRLTAHLALATALRGDRPAGLCGQTAEATLATLVGLEREALARVEKLEEDTSPTLGAWARALRVRNTKDWRLLDERRELTLLEKLEEYQARAETVRPGEAMRRLDERGVDEVPDWGYLTARFLSVESGHRFLNWGLALQLAEIDAVWRSLRREDLTAETWVEALNAPPAGLVVEGVDGVTELRALGWGAWGPFLHRHLAELLVYSGGFLRHTLGLPGEAEAFAESARQRFGRLMLFPLVQRHWAGDEAEYRIAMARARGLAERTPELLTISLWDRLAFKPSFVKEPVLLPDHVRWFDPPLPSGTLYAFGSRFSRLPGLELASPEVLAQLREHAPYDYTLANATIRPRADHSKSVEEIEREFGEPARYNVRVLASLAQRAWYETERFREYQGRICDLDAAGCYTLGHRLAELDLPDEAARAYQRGFDGDADRVGAANRSSWLVDYYLRNNQEKKALEVAGEAASTYSSIGLRVYAGALERLGRLEEAEDYYLRIRDRYEGTTHLGFYYRRVRVDGLTEYETRFEDALRAVFPDGLEEVSAASFESPPTDGVVFLSANDNTKRHGLKWGDVIVAVDGFRVHNWTEYFAVRNFDLSPKMTLTVWQGQDYRDVPVELHDRRFNVDMDTYEPPDR